jgi:hypothetical protein
MNDLPARSDSGVKPASEDAAAGDHPGCSRTRAPLDRPPQPIPPRDSTDEAGAGVDRGCGGRDGEVDAEVVPVVRDVEGVAVRSDVVGAGPAADDVEGVEPGAMLDVRAQANLRGVLRCSPRESVRHLIEQVHHGPTLNDPHLRQVHWGAVELVEEPDAVSEEDRDQVDPQLIEQPEA